MGTIMQWTTLTTLAIAVGCGSPNPDFCCVTEAQCAAAGVTDELRPCGAGQACNASSECVAAECTTSIDCTSPDRPTCQNSLCVEGCTVDEDCLGVPEAPHCDASSGECVGCLSNDQCPPATAICDLDSRSCRSCASDLDCGDGVCVEVTGECVAADDAIYVASNGIDGNCLKTSPCLTIGFALGKVTPTRRVIKILSSLDITSTLSVDVSAIIDGDSGAQLTFAVNPGLLASTNVVLEGLTLRAPTIATMLRVVDGAAVTVFGAAFEDASTVEIDGELSFVRSRARNVDFLRCTDGRLTIRESRLEDAGVEASNCNLEISRSHLGPAPSFGNETIRAATGGVGVITIENNVIEERGDSVIVTEMSGQPGSSFRFNTVVFTGTTGGAKMNCSGFDVTSNIIALNSALSLSPGCMAHDSLFDLKASVPAGADNVSADSATFFVNRAAGDFHLAPDSPARGLGEAGMVDVDFDGMPRPATAPDVGAFESP